MDFRTSLWYKDRCLNVSNLFPDRKEFTKYKINKKQTCIDVFCFGIYTILNDIISTGASVLLTNTSTSRCEINFNWLQIEKSKIGWQLGRYDGIDYIKTEFKVPRLSFKAFGKSKRCTFTRIYLDSKMKKKFIENANNGKLKGGIKTLDNYIESINEAFPDLTRKQISGIMRVGLNTFKKYIRNGCDIRIAKSYFTTQFYAPMKDFSYEDLNKRRYRKYVQINNNRKFPFIGYYYAGFTINDFKEILVDPEKREIILNSASYFKELKHAMSRCKNKEVFLEVGVYDDLGSMFCEPKIITDYAKVLLIRQWDANKGKYNIRRFAHETRRDKYI